MVTVPQILTAIPPMIYKGTNEAQSQTLGLPPPQRTGLFNGRGYVARMDSEGKAITLKV